MRILRTCLLLMSALCFAALPDRAAGDSFGSGANAFDIEFVEIGNPANPADTTFTGLTGDLYRTSAGSVDYAYRIGKFEISREMIDKANAEGLLGITLTDLSTFGGNGPLRPATGASWNEAARFVNWLNTSHGFSPAYSFLVQPGDAGYSANADIRLWSPGDAGYDPSNLFRNSLAKYVLPSVDEWYKAAFYAPSSGVYYDYATGSNTAPAAVASGTAPGTAVFNQSIFSSGKGPADIALAGGLSPYGTMAQAGNVGELEETEYDLVNDSPSYSRGMRVAPWFAIASELSIRGGQTPTSEIGHIGFRVASVSAPEPHALALWALAAIGLSLMRRQLLPSQHGFRLDRLLRRLRGAPGSERESHPPHFSPLQASTTSAATACARAQA